MYKITKTTTDGKIETTANLTLSQGNHLLKGLHKIKLSARRHRTIGVTLIVKMPGTKSFSCTENINDVYFITIYQLEEQSC